MTPSNLESGFCTNCVPSIDYETTLLDVKQRWEHRKAAIIGSIVLFAVILAAIIYPKILYLLFLLIIPVFLLCLLGAIVLILGLIFLAFDEMVGKTLAICGIVIIVLVLVFMYGEVTWALLAKMSIKMYTDINRIVFS